MRHTWTLILGLLFTGCATKGPAATFQPVSLSPEVVGFIQTWTTRVLIVSNHPEKNKLEVKLADLQKNGAAGMSVGGRVIYLDWGLTQKAHAAWITRGHAAVVRGAIPGPTVRWLMVLAHEIAHDELGHVAAQSAVQDALSGARLATGILSYVPVIGLAAGLTSHGLRAAQSVTSALYGRAHELDADKKAIGYWKKMGLPCTIWVQYFQALADKGIAGDFKHPTEGRLEQASALCPEAGPIRLPPLQPDSQPNDASSLARPTQ